MIDDARTDAFPRSTRSRKDQNNMRPSLTVLLLALVGGAAGLSIAASPLRNRVPVMISRAPQPLMSETGEPDVADRAFACMPYILPALDGFSFGAYVYKNVPGGMGACTD
tara:strand:- start:3160 stop:3489 length:330 start_codon:yes stop_codon:yes gene_type:complete